MKPQFHEESQVNYISMRNYPAKVLLFGEYTVLFGSKALAVPFEKFSVSWSQEKPMVDQRLLDLYQFLQHNFEPTVFDFAKMKADLERCWQLEGNMPSGYGIGSSGTVCAAFFDRFASTKSKQLTFSKKKTLLAKMEGFYHGQSSGTDPLISLSNQPIEINKDVVQPALLPENWSSHFFLLDTNVSRVAAPFIERFKQQLTHDKQWKSEVAELWASTSDDCVDALLNAQIEQLVEQFERLSDQQAKLVKWLIPNHIQKVWKGESYTLKLCGAGGGGFMLGYSYDWETTKSQLKDYTLYKL